MESIFNSKEKSLSESPTRRWAGIFDWVLSHRLARLTIPPAILIGLIALLTIPLFQDLCRLSEDGMVLVQADQSTNPHDGNIIINIKNINPNNGIVTLDLTYVTDDIDKGKVELLISTGGVTLNKANQTYDVDAEFRRIPVVLDSPTIFEWGETKRATYKYENAEIKVEKRSQGYFYPFDWYAIEFSFSVIDKNQHTFRPSLWCELDDPRFVHYRPQPLRTWGQHIVTVPNSVSVLLERPIYQKLFLGISMLMGLGCVIWSIYKITYTTVDAMESLSLLAFDFTVLLAVPSLRGVFVPSNLQFAPLFDFFVVLIWTVGLMALCVNIIRHDIVIRIREMAAAKNAASAANDALPIAAEDEWFSRQVGDGRDSLADIPFNSPRQEQDFIPVDSRHANTHADERAKLHQRLDKFVPRKAG